MLDVLLKIQTDVVAATLCPGTAAQISMARLRPICMCNQVDDDSTTRIYMYNSRETCVSCLASETFVPAVQSQTP